MKAMKAMTAKRAAMATAEHERWVVVETTGLLWLHEHIARKRLTGSWTEMSCGANVVACSMSCSGLQQDKCES